MKNLFITGALGHIGSRLIHELKPGEFDKVVILDNLSTQRYPSLFHLPQGIHFEFIEDDICTADLDKYFWDIDVVIHLAAVTDAASSFEKAAEVEKVNFLGTERVARACIKNGCRLLFPSTTSVYGTQNEVVDENCSLEELKPQSPYAEAKLKSERLLTELGEKEQLRFITCRFGTIFGTSVGMRFHTAVNKFCWQAAMGQPLTVWKTALQQKRPYLDIIDCVRATRFIVKKDLFDGSIYNILTTNAAVQDIIQVISSVIPNTMIKYVDTQIMNQLSYVVANERFKQQGFVFGGNLDKGIKETIQLIQQAHGAIKGALV